MLQLDAVFLDLRFDCQQERVPWVPVSNKKYVYRRGEETISHTVLYVNASARYLAPSTPILFLWRLSTCWQYRTVMHILSQKIVIVTIIITLMRQPLKTFSTIYLHQRPARGDRMKEVPRSRMAKCRHADLWHRCIMIKDISWGRRVKYSIFQSFSRDMENKSYERTASVVSRVTISNYQRVDIHETNENLNKSATMTYWSGVITISLNFQFTLTKKEFPCQSRRAH
jgi:hypothetical protein